MSFCTCTDTSCPFHPSNHDQGCTPCIAKNQREGEIPTCLFRDAERRLGAQKPTDGWHYADFAALIAAGAEDDRP